MRSHDRQVVHSSKFHDWGTPPEMYLALDRHFGFGLDAAASSSNHLHDTWFGPDHPDPARRDGLITDWRQVCVDDGRPFVAFLNPPYSREGYAASVKAGQPNRALLIEAWVERAALWGQQMTVVAVLPASVQTRWWQQFVRQADAIWFIPHRVTFVASRTMLRRLNREREAAGKSRIAGAWNASGNTAVVIWRPNPGFIGRAEPTIRYWSYRDAA